MKKYLVCPGFVIASDGDKHWINPAQLMSLYGVDEKDCAFQRSCAGRYPREWDNLVRLVPQSSGNYSIPATDATRGGKPS